MKEEPLDLSALDVDADWDSRVDATIERAREIVGRRRRNDPLSVIDSWSLPIAVLAALTLLVSVPFIGPWRSENLRGAPGLAATTSLWSVEGRHPDGGLLADLLMRDTR